MGAIPLDYDNLRLRPDVDLEEIQQYLKLE